MMAYKASRGPKSPKSYHLMKSEACTVLSFLTLKVGFEVLPKPDAEDLL